MSEAHFIDTSALVKRYIDEPGSRSLAKRCFSRRKIEVFASALTYAEIYATFSRLLREGNLTTVEYETIVAAFERDWLSFVVVELAPSIRHHIPKLARAQSLRGADVAQLASAVHLFAHKALDLFVACDVRLANAALAMGLPLFNPEV